MSSSREPELTFEQLEHLKQASRDADERALAEGRLTPAELERKNLFLDPARTIVHWDRSKPL